MAAAAANHLWRDIAAALVAAAKTSVKLVLDDENELSLKIKKARGKVFTFAKVDWSACRTALAQVSAQTLTAFDAAYAANPPVGRSNGTPFAVLLGEVPRRANARRRPAQRSNCRWLRARARAACRRSSGEWTPRTTCRVCSTCSLRGHTRNAAEVVLFQLGDVTVECAGGQLTLVKEPTRATLTSIGEHGALSVRCVAVLRFTAVTQR